MTNTTMSEISNPREPTGSALRQAMSDGAAATLFED